LRSCYSSTWNFFGKVVKGYYYFSPLGTPHYPDWHYFGSRNWHQGDGTPEPEFGELAGIRQKWRNGSFPTTPPDVIRIGEQSCIESGSPADNPPPALIAGVDIRCWKIKPPWGGLAGGGLGRFAVIRGGLAGGGDSHVEVVGGGLAGGGSSPARTVLGGLAGGGLSPATIVLGGLAGGGLSPATIVLGGLAGGGLSPARVVLGGLAGGGSSPTRAVAGGLAGGGASTFSVVLPTNAIQYAFAKASNAGNVVLNGTWPASTTTNSLLVAVVSCKFGAFSGTISAPAGWTSTLQQNQGLTTVQIFYKAAAASQTTTGNFQVNNISGTADGILLVGEYHPGGGGGLDKQAQQAGVSSSPSTPHTGTLSQASETIVAGLVATTAGTFTSPQNSYLIGIQKSQGAITAGLLDKLVSATTSEFTGATLSSSAWCASITTYKT
jgi:hypothetical protein